MPGAASAGKARRSTLRRAAWRSGSASDVGQQGSAPERARVGRAGGVPDPHGRIGTRRGDVSAVGAKGHGVDLVRVAFEDGARLLRVLGAPEFDCAVIAGPGKDAAIGLNATAATGPS